jgi:hypothetical protein
MLTAMAAVENIVNGVTGKDNIWSINTEQDYHEQKTDGHGSTESNPAAHGPTNRGPLDVGWGSIKG